MAKRKKSNLGSAYGDGTPKGKGLKTIGQAIQDAKKNRPKTKASQRKRPNKLNKPLTKAEKAREKARQEALSRGNAFDGVPF